MVLMALVVAAPVAAQESGGSLVDRFLLATHLPTVAREARILGVPEGDLQALLAGENVGRVAQEGWNAMSARSIRALAFAALMTGMTLNALGWSRGAWWRSSKRTT